MWSRGRTRDRSGRTPARHHCPVRGRFKFEGVRSTISGSWAGRSRPRLRRMVSIASGVFAQFGAARWRSPFATLGAPGMVTRWMSSLGFNPWNHGFSRYTFFGVALVYTYFRAAPHGPRHHPRSRGAAPNMAKGGVRARGQHLAPLRSPSHLPLRLAMVDNGGWCLATGRLRPAKNGDIAQGSFGCPVDFQFLSGVYSN